jgi:hypothetical protein
LTNDGRGFVQAVVGHCGFAPVGRVPDMPQSKPSRRIIAQFDALRRQIAHPVFASRRAHLL